MRINLKKKGFTFLEMIVAMFIFVLVMVTVTNIFGRALTSFSKTRNLQKDLENAQFSMNSMAKILRTSKVIRCFNSITNDKDCSLVASPIIKLKSYDYSQCKCFTYYFNPGGSLQTGSITDDNGGTDLCHEVKANNEENWCDRQNPTTINATTGIVNGIFSVNQSTSSAFGKVTIRIDVAAPPKDMVRIQSSVSLRNKTQ